MLSMRVMNRPCLALALSITLAGLVAGCSQDEHAAVYPVKGTITYHDAPVIGAEVVFLPPNDATDATPAQATTDAYGGYSLQTFFNAAQEVSGARPGSYHVTITKIEAPTGVVDPYATGKAPEIKNLLPKKYADADTSPLQVEVSSGNNLYDFDLQD